MQRRLKNRRFKPPDQDHLKTPLYGCRNGSRYGVQTDSQQFTVVLKHHVSITDVGIAAPVVRWNDALGEDGGVQGANAVFDAAEAVLAGIPG
jgi:hypothetical protein